MKEYSGIAVTDQINRYNEIFSLHAMYSAYNMQWNEIIPSFVNHDHTKCIGITQLTGIFLEPKRAYTANRIMIGESEDDYKIIKQYNYNYLYRTCIANNIEKYNSLEDSIKAYVIGNVIKYWTNAVFIYNEGIVARMFPELAKEINKGLININLLEPILPGVYKYNGFLIFAHRYFRRGFSYLNTLNTAFLERIERLSRDNPELDIKIAIDLNCIGLAGSEHKEFEYQYWWGPKFNNSLNDIPLGVTRYNNEHYNELLSNVQFVDFGWYIQDNKHTFECEEVTDIPNIRINNTDMYGCRFIHSMVDQAGNPIHLDGAIRAYDDEKMIERIDIPIKDCERNTLYTKLWRIDGRINVETWKELISHYYRDNMMVGEYFGGVDEKLGVIIEEDKKETTVSLIDFIPCSINSGDGLRVFFSYIKPYKTDCPKEILIIPTFSIYEDNVLKECVEIETIDFYKFLLRKGLSVTLSSENHVSFDDTIYNYPIFACRDLETANAVLDSLQLFCHTWQERGDDRVISISIRVNYSERTANFSFLGHVDDFVRFLNTELKNLPEEEKIYEWLQGTYDYISDHSNNKCEDHPFVFLKQNRVLGIERCYIPPEKIDNITADSVELFLTEDEQKTMDENHISICCVWKIKKQVCSKCGKDYNQCNCIKDIDKDVYTRIESAKRLGLAWTNKSAYYF